MKSFKEIRSLLSESVVSMTDKELIAMCYKYDDNPPEVGSSEAKKLAAAKAEKKKRGL